jgi:prephenate dehydrogenase
MTAGWKTGRTPRNLPLETLLANTETPAVRWKKVTLVGVGLLGGSLGLALRKRRLAASVMGFVRRPVSIREALRAGAVSDATMDLEEAVQGADLIVFCTPLGQMRVLADHMLPALKPGAVVTDVGSVKETVVSELEPIIARAGGRFIGSHPMAGSEKTGVSASNEKLFENAICVITPTRHSSRAAVTAVQALWKSVGCRVLKLPPRDHDELVSRSSHLPHLIAAGLASFVLGPSQPREQALLCANGFRDSTRIASGSPEMWRDIALANRPNLVKALDHFTAELRTLRRLLSTGDANRIQSFLVGAKQRRDAWAQGAGSPSPE